MRMERIEAATADKLSGDDSAPYKAATGEKLSWDESAPYKPTTGDKLRLEI